MEEERIKIEQEERERAKIKRQSLESAVEDKVKRQLQNVFARADVSYLKDKLLFYTKCYLGWNGCVKEYWNTTTQSYQKNCRIFSRNRCKTGTLLNELPEWLQFFSMM